MNKRHNLSDKHVSKRAKKEVRKAMKKDSLPSTNTSPIKKPSKLLKSTDRIKKVSKRTSPSKKIENSSPAYPHKEGSRWITTTRKKIASQKIRHTKKGN
jgi:hypothetical protein